MAAVSWRRNIYVMFAAELIVIMGFQLIMPFMPLFVKELGDYSSSEAALWSGIAIGVSSIALFLSGPVWGVISDRVGRKPMVLRALFGTAVIQALSALSPNIYIFVALRFLQGLFSGTVPAASAMVASTTPRDRTSYAMGLLNLGIFCGNTLGPSLGGVLGDVFGYRACFFIASGLQLVAAMLVLFLVREDFQRPVTRSSLGDVWRLLSSGLMLPLLVAICFVATSQQIIQPVITLFIHELNPAGSASTSAGLAFASLGLAAAFSSVAVGRWLSQRFSLRKILVISCLGAALLNVCPIWIHTVVQLIVLMGALGLFQGASVTCTSSLIVLSMPASQQGIAFGLSQSAMSLGYGLGPMMGGSLVSVVGLRYVFPVAAGLFVITSLLVARFIKEQPRKELPLEV